MKRRMVLLVFAAALSGGGFARAADKDTRIDFYGSSAKEAYLKMQQVYQHDDSIVQTNGAGSTFLSSSNLNCRYSHDDSGARDLRKVSPDNFSCYFMMNNSGEVRCEKTAAPHGKAAAKKRNGST